MKKKEYVLIFLLVFCKTSYCGMSLKVGKFLFAASSFLSACAYPIDTDKGLYNEKGFLDVDVNINPDGNPLNVAINEPLSVTLTGIPEWHKIAIAGTIALTLTIAVGYSTFRIVKFGCDGISQISYKCFKRYQHLNDQNLSECNNQINTTINQPP